MQNINALSTLINKISRLPGLGQRSARRIALHLMQDREVLHNLVQSMLEADEVILECSECGNMDNKSPCHICTDGTRDTKSMCIVESISDLWSIERSQSFKGQYHILGGVLSSINNITPEKLRLYSLRDRVIKLGLNEIIISIGTTLDGQTTEYYIHDILSEFGKELKITKLALGIPIGADLEYMDEGTISIAMKSRQSV